MLVVNVLTDQILRANVLTDQIHLVNVLTDQIDLVDVLISVMIPFVFFVILILVNV